MRLQPAIILRVDRSRRLPSDFSQCLADPDLPSSTTTSSGGTITPAPPAAASTNHWFSLYVPRSFRVTSRLPLTNLRIAIPLSGDSYTQTGFEITGTSPAVGNPLGNPPYPWLGCYRRRELDRLRHDDIQQVSHSHLQFCLRGSYDRC